MTWLLSNSMTPIRPVTIYRPLGWSNWHLGVDIDHFENHRLNTKHEENNDIHKTK